MAATKEQERTYTIPLRRAFQKVPVWRRSKKAVKAAKEFLQKHMKSDNVKLSKSLNEKIWGHGAKNPPARVKVSVSKDKEGKVSAELFGIKNKKEVVKASKKAVKTPKVEAKKEEKSEVKEKETVETKVPKKE
jgi:large subunit ribosomal protein L31e